VDLDLIVLVQRMGRRTQQLELHRDQLRGPPRSLRNQLIASMELVFGDAREVDGDPFAGFNPLSLLTVDMEPPDSDSPLTGEDEDLGADLERAPQRGTSDHRPGTGQREHPINRLSERTVLDLVRRCIPGLLKKDGSQNAHAVTRVGRHRNNWCITVPRWSQELPNLLDRQVSQILLHQIDLGHGHDNTGYAHKSYHLEMLACLRHQALVRRDHQQRSIDTRGPRHHCVDQSLVPRDIDEMELQLVLGKLGESQIDGDPPFSLLGQSIAIGARECLYQGGLAMIDVTGCSEYDVAHGLIVPPPTRALGIEH